MICCLIPARWFIVKTVAVSYTSTTKHLQLRCHGYYRALKCALVAFGLIKTVALQFCSESIYNFIPMQVCDVTCSRLHELPDLAYIPPPSLLIHVLRCLLSVGLPAHTQNIMRQIVYFYMFGIRLKDKMKAQQRFHFFHEKIIT